MSQCKGSIGCQMLDVERIPVDDCFHLCNTEYKKSCNTYCNTEKVCSNLYYKKLSYRRGTARCVVSVEILPIATQQCSTSPVQVMKLEG